MYLIYYLLMTFCKNKFYTVNKNIEVIFLDKAKNKFVFTLLSSSRMEFVCFVF